jgi:two-component system NtrC family sensor kinase
MKKTITAQTRAGAAGLDRSKARKSKAHESKPRKSGVPKAVSAESRKLNPTKSTSRKMKPYSVSEAARLREQLKTSRLQQEASAEILRAVANAAGEAAGPLQLIAETTARLFGAGSVSIQLAEGLEFTQEYRVGAIAKRVGSAYPRSNIKVGGRNLPGTVVAESRQIHIPDLDHLDPSMSDFPGLPHARAGGARTVCGTPLRRDSKAIGALIVFRDRLAPFTDEELVLQQTFADQAVIAIENARLVNEVQTKSRDLEESLQQQTATAEVLQVTSNSPGELQPVFRAVLENATRICDARFGTLFRFDRGAFYFAADVGTPEALAEYVRKPGPFKGLAGGMIDRILKTRQVQYSADYAAEAMPGIAARLGGARSTLGVPILRDDVLVGAIVIYRQEVRPFSDRDVDLVRSFAAQAAIAIENARLFSETREALARQTASADILRVISRSQTDVQPVFDAIVRTAVRLIGCDRAFFMRVDGQTYTPVAGVNRDGPVVLGPRQPIDPAVNFPSRAIAAGQMLHLPDWSLIELPEYERQIHERHGARSSLLMPLLRGDDCIGLLALVASQPNAFSATEIALAQSFCDQALIAIENARLFCETQEALERQTATADILKVIASSPSDVQPVFEAIATRANSLVGGFSATVFRFIDGMAHLVAFTPTTPGADKVLTSTFPTSVDSFTPFQMAQNGKVTQVRDTETLTGEILEVSRARGFQSMLFAPLMNKGASIGLIVVTRASTGAFSDHHVQLLRTFADQAVIAIENVRLFDEVQAKTRDLTEALQQQTATADVLKVISRSAFDLQTVLETLARSAVELSGALNGIIFLRDGDVFRYRASSHGDSNPEWVKWLEEHPQRPGRNTATARAIATGKVACVEDVAADPEVDLPATPLAGIRAALSVPLLRDGKVEGVMTLTRQVPGPFTDRQIELVQTFADQAVIAIENVRLFEEVQARTQELAKSLEDLRTAQDRLVQTEKLASLGQLTAGIAHEIKNPLNFVNNFSALSVELTDELNDLLKAAEVSEDMRREVDELTSLLKENLAKVVQHGKRADSIVKNMLLHSRDGSGEHRPSDVNALVEESLNLAYHGARAEKSRFNVTIERDLDPEAGKIEVFPQEITRVLLNLISNGFYAVDKRKAENGNGVFTPVVKATTRGQPAHVEIRIRDNGTGIPPEVKEKMFNPFFTTKPAGEGTGLGLSMSHDIVVKQHGGTIDVETVPGEFTEFKITLPRGGRLSS